MTTTLLRAGHLIHTDPTVRIEPAVDLLIDGDTIARTGLGLDVPADRVIDASGFWVLPGFVDTHRHLWQTALRGRLPTGTLAQYLDRVMTGVGPHYRPEDVAIANLAGALDCLDAGITTVVDWSHIQNSPAHADHAVAGLREAGIRAVFAHGFGLPMNAGGHSPDAKRVRTELLADDDALVTMALGIAGPQFGPADVAAADLRLARDLGCRASIHVHDDTAIDALDRLGLLGEDLTFVHGNDLSDRALRRIADTGGSLSISPQTETQLAMGAPVTARAVRAGVTTSFSIDTVVTAAGDMFSQLRMALAAAGGAVSPSRLLAMATTGGAATIGRSDRIGSLRPGHQADLQLLRRDAPGMAGAADPVAAIVTGADRSTVDTVFVAGRIVKRAGRQIGPRPDDIAGRLAESAARIEADTRE